MKPDKLWVPADVAPDVYRLSTEEFANQWLVAAQTVRKCYSKTGAYHGIRPLRLPNRRLLWPDNTITSLVKRAGVAEV